MVGGLNTNARHGIVFSIRDPVKRTGFKREPHNDVSFTPYPFHGDIVFNISVGNSIQQRLAFAQAMHLVVLTQNYIHAG